MAELCHFCNGPDAVYEKRDRAGMYRAACWDCVKPKAKEGSREVSPHGPEPDLTFLDDDAPPTPVGLITPTTPKPQGNLF